VRLGQHLFRAIPVLDIGCVNLHDEEITSVSTVRWRL
jgi:hypothetical protein